MSLGDESMSNADYDQALVELGRSLHQAGWRPDIPLGSTLDADEGNHYKWRVWALLFVETNKKGLQTALCKEGKVRPGIGLGTEVAVHVASHLSGLTWIESAVAGPLANVLCHLGLTTFCES